MEVVRTMKTCRGALLAMSVALSMVDCASIGSPGSAPAVSSAAVLATIPVGRAPTYLALAPDGSRVYAASDGSLTVIETAGNTVAAKLSTGPNTTGIAVTPNGARVLITNLLSVSMTVIDTATNTIGKPITLLAQRFTGGFGRIAVLPNSDTAWVANQDNEVLAIARLDGSEVQGRDMDMRPVDIALSPDGRLAYIAGCRYQCVPGTVEVIDVAQQTTQAYINVGPSPYRIAMAPDGTRLYTTNLADSSVSVVDVGTRSLVANVQVGVEPTGLAVAPGGSVIYVTSQDLGTVTAIDAATHAIRSTLRVGDHAREVVVTPDGQRLYVSTLNTVIAVATSAFIGGS